ncbi:unnamed protein product [Arabis nemorensis]|uniref:Uncharacterized protein n=1 Tax=Arabis nemorensis TaxID=586526 RepID=A0A565BTG5_9BRAS|nr:unnamed protein product [Arabis nemorensis]
MRFVEKKMKQGVATETQRLRVLPEYLRGGRPAMSTPEPANVTVDGEVEVSVGIAEDRKKGKAKGFVIRDFDQVKGGECESNCLVQNQTKLDKSTL